MKLSVFWAEKSKIPNDKQQSEKKNDWNLPLGNKTRDNKQTLKIERKNDGK